MEMDQDTALGCATLSIVVVFWVAGIEAAFLVVTLIMGLAGLQYWQSVRNVVRPNLELQALLRQLSDLSISQDLERKIVLYRQLLDSLEKDKDEQLWASIHYNLANALTQTLPHRDQSNVVQAINHYRQALTVSTYDKDPKRWAAIQNNMAAIYKYKMGESKQENIERVVYFYEQALKVFTRQTEPERWASIQYNLGIVYSGDIHEPTSEQIEKAINHYHNVLEVRTQNKDPKTWSNLQNKLGAIYGIRMVGDQNENIEKAINHYHNVFELVDKVKEPDLWAVTQHSLAQIYTRRVSGSRGENLELAIYHFRHALQIYDEEKNATQWALVQNNLATTFVRRVSGSQNENISEAITMFEQLLKYYTKIDDFAGIGTIHNNLAIAYIEMNKDDGSENLEKAILYCKKALDYFTYERYPEDWAKIQNNLAVAQKNRSAGDLAQNIEQAIGHYQNSFKVYSRQNFPNQWAKIHYNLGKAYQDRVKGCHAENVNQAVYHFKQSLEVRRPRVFPVEHRDTLVSLVTIYFSESRWHDVYEVTPTTIAADNEVFVAAYTDADRQYAIASTGRLYAQISYSALKLGKYNEALEFLESGKARLLSDALSFSETNLRQLESEDRKQLTSLRDQLHSFNHKISSMAHDSNMPFDSIHSASHEVWVKLYEMLGVLKNKYPNFMPDSLSIYDILDLIPIQSALVAPLFTSCGSAIFVIPNNIAEVTADYVLMLDDYNLDNLYELTRYSDNSKGWLQNYVDFRFGQASIESMKEGINEITSRMWNEFVGEIHKKLDSLSIRNIIILPQSDVSLLPIHASWRDVDGQERYLMDDYRITNVPSVFTFQNSMRSVHNGWTALVAGVSKYSQLNDLPYARVEVENIAEILGVNPIIDEAVSVDVIKSRVSEKSYVHLACHGSYGWTRGAIESSLYLTDDEELSLDEIVAELDFNSARLVVLSACETGVVDFQNLPDEFVGLSTGIIEAGASAVISSLWSVNDHSTALLMERMYQFIVDEENPMSPSDALRAAQLWLRDSTAQELGEYYESFFMQRMTKSAAFDAYIDLNLGSFKANERPYSHPYFWAPFTYTGV